MKYMNIKKRYGTMNLQLFAEGDGAGDESGGDDQDEDDSDEEDSDEDGENEDKKFSQKDVDEAIKKRLAREKRKWQREQKKASETDGKARSTDEGKSDDNETQKLREKAEKAEYMEMKWTCLEHDVSKSCVDDVLALAKVHMEKGEDDIEDAIDEVLKKYPQFKESYSDEDEEKRKAWGERQRGRGKKVSGVEAAFYRRNPSLKEN